MQPGDRLGAYGIVGFIGAGAVGKVRRARDERLEREVALKVLPAEKSRLAGSPAVKAVSLDDTLAAAQFTLAVLRTWGEVDPVGAALPSAGAHAGPPRDPSLRAPPPARPVRVQPAERPAGN